MGRALGANPKWLCNTPHVSGGAAFRTRSGRAPLAVSWMVLRVKSPLSERVSASMRGF